MAPAYCQITDAKCNVIGPDSILIYGLAPYHHISMRFILTWWCFHLESPLRSNHSSWSYQESCLLLWLLWLYNLNLQVSFLMMLLTDHYLISSFDHTHCCLLWDGQVLTDLIRCAAYCLSLVVQNYHLLSSERNMPLKIKLLNIFLNLGLWMIITNQNLVEISKTLSLEP